MERNFAVVTIFALLFAVSTARISLDPTPANTKSSPETTPEGDSNLVLPSDASQPDESDHPVPELDADQHRMFSVDVTPRSEFARFHAINRHFFDEPRIPIRSIQRRPYRHFLNPFVIPRSVISNGNEVVLSAETGENFRRQSPAKRMKFKHDYGHRHHRHQHHHFHHDNTVAKHRFDREKVKSLVQNQHKEKKRQHEAGFMTSIRKFLKHSFD